MDDSLYFITGRNAAEAQRMSDGAKRAHQIKNDFLTSYPPYAPPEILPDGPLLGETQEAVTQSSSDDNRVQVKVYTRGSESGKIVLHNEKMTAYAHLLTSGETIDSGSRVMLQFFPLLDCYEIIRTGGGGSAKILGIVTETISRPSNPYAAIPSGMGKVKIYGKSYDKDDPAYDQATCLELAETEKVLRGTQVELQVLKEVDNPDYDPEHPEGDGNLPKTTYYTVVNTLGEYTGKLQSDLLYGGTSTIQISEAGDGNGEPTMHDYTVRCLKLASGQKLSKDMGVTVSRTESGYGRILEVMLGPCPVTS